MCVTLIQNNKNTSAYPKVPKGLQTFPRAVIREK